MVTVQNCPSLPEAQMLKSLLEGSGVTDFLPDEYTLQNNWMWTNAIGGVRIQVRDEDAGRAREILSQADAPEDP
jgi:hypothetical protein